MDQNKTFTIMSLGISGNYNFPKLQVNDLLFFVKAKNLKEARGKAFCSYDLPTHKGKYKNIEYLIYDEDDVVLNLVAKGKISHKDLENIAVRSMSDWGENKEYKKYMTKKEIKKAELRNWTN